MTERTEFGINASLLALALLIGGAGVSFPLLQMTLILASLGAAAYYLLHPVNHDSRTRRQILALVAAIFALGLLQLVPLPEQLWRSLPGRDIVSQLDQIFGWHFWRPLSLDVEGTIRSLLVLIPAVVVLAGCMRLSFAQRSRLLWVVGGFAVFSAVLGILQFAGGGALTPYPSAHTGFPIGLFVNRNHQAAFLLAAMPIVSAIGSRRLASGHGKAAVLTITISACLLLAIVIVATTSRMGLILLPFMMLASLAILFAGQSALRVALPSIALVVAVAVVLWLGGGLANNLARFSSLDDSRFDYWNDVRWALDHYGLAGTGFGTFVPIYKSSESLTAITPAIVNHAHNDYIELLLEGGLPAALFIVLFFLLLGAAMVRLRKSKSDPKSLKISFAAFSGIGTILVFSLVDYPLRMPAVGVVFALIITLFVLPERDGTDQASVTKSKIAPRLSAKWVRVASLIGLAAIGVVAIQAGVSERMLQGGNADYATQWAPWSTQAHSRAATEDLFENRKPGPALAAAAAALRLSPVDAPALRTMGIVAGIAGDSERSIRAMQLASTLGWRDPVTNLWAVGASIQTNDPVRAVQHAEAMYRQHQFIPEVTDQMLSLNLRDPMTRLLVADLQTRPDWRWGFLRSAGQIPDRALPGFEDLVIALNRSAAPASMDEGQALLDRLTGMDQLAARRRVWLSLHQRGLIANGGFEDVSNYRGSPLPRGWDISDENLTALSIDNPGSAGSPGAIRLYSAANAEPLISQDLLLDSGSYALTFDFRVKSARGGQLQWKLRCLEASQDTEYSFPLAGGTAWRTAQASVTVPNQHCSNQRLALALIGVDDGTTVWIDNVALKQRRLTTR